MITNTTHLTSTLFSVPGSFYLIMNMISAIYYSAGILLIMVKFDKEVARGKAN